MIEITEQMVRDGLAAVVAEYGENYVYERDEMTSNACTYVRNGEPSCIVGKFLFDLGVPLDVLEDLDTMHNGDSISIGLALRTSPHFRAVDNAEFMLSRAQNHQDEGATWGESLRYALEAH